jgi:predicted nucleic acid-binding protein
MDIIVDSSVWIDFFNFYQSKEADGLQNLIEHNNTNNIFICPAIYNEIMEITNNAINIYLSIQGVSVTRFL